MTLRMRSFRDRIARLDSSGRTILALHNTQATPGGVGNVLIRCPDDGHEDRSPSCSVRLDDGKAHCFGCSWRAGDAVALHQALGGFESMADALADLESYSGAWPEEFTLLPSQGGPRGARRGLKLPGRPVVVRRWSYAEADGRPAFDIVRRQRVLEDGSTYHVPGETKPWKEYRPVDPGSCRFVMPDRYRRELRPLFGLPALIGAPSDLPVYVVEGEPAAEALIDLGYVATTSSGGAGSAHKTDWSPLAGRDVRLWPDNDEPGERYVESVRELLLDLSSPPRIERVDVDALRLPVGGDAVDWAALRRGAAEVSR